MDQDDFDHVHGKEPGVPFTLEDAGQQPGVGQARAQVRRHLNQLANRPPVPVQRAPISAAAQIKGGVAQIRTNVFERPPDIYRGQHRHRQPLHALFHRLARPHQ